MCVCRFNPTLPLHVATAARAAATGHVSMSTRPDPINHCTEQCASTTTGGDVRRAKQHRCDAPNTYSWCTLFLHRKFTATLLPASEHELQIARERMRGVPHYVGVKKKRDPYPFEVGHFCSRGAWGKKKKKEKFPRLVQAFSIRVTERFRVLFHFLSDAGCSALCCDTTTSAIVRISP